MMLSRVCRQQGVIGRNAASYRRAFTVSPQQQRSKSTIDKAKETLKHPVESVKQAGETVNKKTGKKLAEGIEMAEHATEKVKNVHPVEGLKNAGDAANKKAKEELAKGMDAAEGATAKAKNMAKDLKKAGDNVTKRAGEDLAKGMDAAQDVSEQASKKAHKTLDETEKKADEVYKQTKK
ncbi:hypothetical protein BDB00DRAFT_873040 [Zychaea mexicana]|uniref:uncharacterized protein n=1 Tax=Zychaea mexicana TaxID=64656 RepID=UPI0022FF11A5|nr:uncharacterized protein BDB00DRAFT_873040 [Zychaea mexicana]KAI9492821.1 hypothetical protein BDB00DRAFT_873040 [Zychaea mexicana]